MNADGIRAVVIGASWGGVEASIRVLSQLQPGFPVPVFLAQHQRYESESRLARVLAAVGLMPSPRRRVSKSRRPTLP